MSFSVKSSLSEQIAEYISEKIICMEIKPEERILETAIAEELNVSRSPIREALRILEKQRLVKLTPRRGATVTKMSKEFIGDLCDVLTSLLQLTARQCVQNGTLKDLKKINAAAATVQSCGLNDDLHGYYKAVFDFGVTCLHSSKNQLLEQLVIELMPNVRRVLYASFTLNGEELEKNMEMLLLGNRYVQSKNVEMAERTINTYMMKAKESVISL
jgi:DNA-binding GntR family transcriptional regulator